MIVEMSPKVKINFWKTYFFKVVLAGRLNYKVSLYFFNLYSGHTLGLRTGERTSLSWWNEVPLNIFLNYCEGNE